MREIQLSRPVLIALLGAVLIGGYLFYSSTQGGDEFVQPSPAPTSATGATGGDDKGGTGATGPTETAAEARKRRRAELRKKAEEDGIPLRVYLARRANKEVVIFFWEPNGMDDKRVNAALNELKTYRSRLVVFRDRISNKSDYDGIAQAAEITQTPGLVMVYGKKADAWQGYIDAGTLNERLTRLTGHNVTIPGGAPSNKGAM